MKIQFSLRKSLFGTLMILILLAMPLSSASSGPYEEASPNVDKSLYQKGGDGDIAKFRKELLAHYDELFELYPYIENAVDSGFLERVRQSKEWVNSLSDEELLEIKLVFDQNPGLFESQAQLLGIFEQIDSIQRSQFVSANSCPATLPDEWCGCPAGAPGGTEGVYYAKGVAQGFEFAHAFVPSDLVTVVAGVGGTVWAHPARIALRVLYEGAKATALTFEGYDAVNSACHKGYHEAFLVEHDELVQWKLDNTVELRSVQLNVIELKEKREFLVSATESGSPVDGIEFRSIKYATNNNPRRFIDVTKLATITMVDNGVYLVTLRLKNPPANSRIYTFEVRHTNDAVDHFGYIMFDRLGAK